MRIDGDKITEAVNIAISFGMIDGAHHKQWVIDQMLRVFLLDNYQELIDGLNKNKDYEYWDVGISP